MKKYIFTESQIKKIIDNQITGTNQIQEEVVNEKLTMTVQKFLNEIFKGDKTFTPLVVDGKTGRNSSTSDAIIKLQTLLGIDYMSRDGVWGTNTEDAMKTKRADLYKIWTKMQPGLLDRLFN
jgi:hypothetical protein